GGNVRLMLSVPILISDRLVRGVENSGNVVRSVFFFQAEDGIRDRNVTGVQTCALPIFAACAKHFVGYGAAEGGRDYNSVEISERSEERRVGKECRWLWWPKH